MFSPPHSLIDFLQQVAGAFFFLSVVAEGNTIRLRTNRIIAMAGIIQFLFCMVMVLCCDESNGQNVTVNLKIRNHPAKENLIKGLNRRL